MKKILVPFDGSGFSEKAFDKGLEIAEKFKAEITVLTAIQSKQSESGIPLYRIEEIQEEEDNLATKMLKNLEERAKKKDVPFSIKIIRDPSPSDGIVGFADNNDFDLIVIGSHGRTGFKKLVLGSVASGVSAKAKCPVLITKGTK